MSALRTVRQLTAASARLRLSSTPLALRLPLCAARAAHPNATRAFSVSTRSLKATSSSKLLAERLREELAYEVESAADTGTDTEPGFLTAFRKEGIWEIEDAADHDEVFLTRQFGDESIRVMFSIADLETMEDDLEDQEEAEEEGAERKDPPAEFRVVLTITKTNSPGSLNVDMYCTEGVFQTAGITFYKSATVGRDLTIESDFARRSLYTGPPFATLDENLQANFDEFLTERGINNELAHFIPNYAEYKEQKEYMGWLEKVGNFVEA
ncbi:mitochondrial glycoprotein [Mycena epipterygia]|nr:mitochondrial glycoprotein [Mycena epipterygia]